MMYENIYELIEAMAGHVEKTMRSFKQDFYCYDLKRLFELDKRKAPYTRYWYTRETGTWFVNDETVKEYGGGFERQNDYKFIITRYGDGTYEMREVETEKH